MATNYNGKCFFIHPSLRRDFDANYIGKHKDQKAYSYFDSGFVGPITFYKQTENITFIYCEVTASQKIQEMKNLWIVFEKLHDTTNIGILAAWCSCMAAALGCCNHIIATYNDKGLQTINDKAVVLTAITENSTAASQILHNSLDTVIQGNDEKTETELTNMLLKNLTITKETITYVESNTRDQPECEFWFQVRIGEMYCLKAS